MNHRGLREGSRQGVQHPVEAQHIAVGKLTLVRRVQGRTVFITDAAVHILFDVGDGSLRQDLCDSCNQIVLHGPIGEIQH